MVIHIGSPIFKRPTWHGPDDCFELQKNKDKHPALWKSVLWRRGTPRIACNVNETSTDITYSLAEPKPSRIPENVPPIPHNKISRKWRRKLANRSARKLATKDTAIADLVASGWYLVPDAPVSNVNAHALKVRVGTATGQPQEFEAICELPLDDIPPGLFGHIMPSFPHNILGIGIMCDKDCKVLFTKRSVIIYDKNKRLFLIWWRETDGAKLTRISLQPDLANVQPCPDDPDNIQEEATLGLFSAYDLPYIEALVNYLHAAAGYPMRDTWLKAIKAGNYESWTGLTYNNAAKYCPSADETIKEHMVQTRHNVRSTKNQE